MAKKKIETGFFTMADANAVNAVEDLEEAKQLALKRVSDMPNALPENIKKATLAITRASTKNQLVMTIASFVMAHPSEGLKVL